MLHSDIYEHLHRLVGKRNSIKIYTIYVYFLELFDKNKININ